MPDLCPFTYHAPLSLKEALALLKRPQSCLLAGGTILLNTLKKTKKGPDDVVSLRRIGALGTVKETKTKLTLGAMVPIADLERLPVVAETFPSLAAACRQMATTPLRRMATIGGNIASRFFWADLPPVLMSLQARLILETPAGRKEMSVDTFVSRKTEGPFIIATIELLKYRRAAFYLRHTRTMPVDIPEMAVAFSAEEKDGCLTDVHFVLSPGVAAPMRLKKTEKVLEGRKPEGIRQAQIGAALTEDTAGLRLDDHKRTCLENDAHEIIARLRSSSAGMSSGKAGNGAP